MELVKKMVIIQDDPIEEPKEEPIQDALQTINLIYVFISQFVCEEIFLLRKKEVLQWIFGDLSFLPEIEKKNKSVDEIKLKKLEDEWGRAMVKSFRPDLTLDKQWTNLFGEKIAREVYILLGKTVTKPKKMENFQPDWQTEDAIIEVKTQTFHTSGTAGEKILGTPFKYAEIPDLYGKPLKILCIGGAEKICRENYGNLPGERCTSQKQIILDFYRSICIEYIGTTDILSSLI